MAACRWICSIILLILGVIIVVFGGIWQGIQANIVKNIVDEQMTLNPGNQLYPKWQNTPIVIQNKFYFYNWDNAEDFENTTHQGDVPELTIKGPYVYDETRWKNEIDFDTDEPDTVRYTDKRRFVFNEQESGGRSQHENVTIPNLPLLAALSILTDAQIRLLNSTVRDAKPYINRTVDEILFSGYTDNLVDIMVKYGSIFKIDPKKLMPEGKFAVFAGKNSINETYGNSGINEVFRGNGDSSKTNRFYSFDNKTKLSDWWPENSTCSMINGSDGFISGTGITRDSTPYAFDVDECRSGYFVYVGDGSVSDIDTYKFVAANETLAYGDAHPENTCFCRGSTLDGCPQSNGLMDMGGCKMGAKFMASFAHCYGGCSDKVMADSGNIMNPVKSEHETYLQIEPITGMTLEAKKRLQINAYFMKKPRYEKVGNLTEGRIVPIFWFEEGATLTPDLADFFKSNVLLPVRISKIIPYICYGVGAFLILVAILVFVCCKSSYRKRVF